MNLQFLFTVEQAFQISGRGCVLVPGIPSTVNLPSIKVGDRIRLTKPDGRSIDTTVNGVELINYGARKPPENISVPISLPATISKQDVPPGTQVHYLGRASESQPR
jgi:translation elongation factor EF-Tu-like GTPase